MRPPRIKVSWYEGPSRQHLFTRTVAGYFYFRHDYQKRILVEMMKKVAEFCGIFVSTYGIMDDHFHVESVIPQYLPISDEELLRRYILLHPEPTSRRASRPEYLREMLAENGPEAVAWRSRQLLLMGDISQFMKLLKQRYSIWYNKRHNRRGTLWNERFGNTLVQNGTDLTAKMAVYIDLNPVRAGMVKDPADYRFTGYGAAVAGDQRAREGIMFLTGRKTWEEAQAEYRLMLYTTGAGPREKGYVFSQEELDKVIRQGGKLPFPTALLKKTNYFTNTLVLGSKEFVEKHLAMYRAKTGHLMRQGPRPMPSYADWGGIFALRRPKNSPAPTGA